MSEQFQQLNFQFGQDHACIDTTKEPVDKLKNPARILIRAGNTNKNKS